MFEKRKGKDKEDIKFKLSDKVIALDEEEPIVYIINKIYMLNNMEFAILIGYNFRKVRETVLNNLRKANESEIKKENTICKKYEMRLTNIRSRYGKKYILGKVLHIDGDSHYLNKCLNMYKKIGLYAYGVMIDEEKMANEVLKYIYQINPDIIVITGHDLFNQKNIKDLNNYTNSKYYVDTVKEIRKVDKNVVIIAGACQSNFEALIANGADFASSPKRINIHTFDPVVVAVKVATTSFGKIVNLEEVYKYIENGKNAIGGLETFGKMRLLI